MWLLLSFFIRNIVPCGQLDNMAKPDSDRTKRCFVTAIYSSLLLMGGCLMDHRHLFLQDLLSSPPGSTQPELLLGGQQLQLTSPSYICKSFPPQQQSGRAVFPALHFISAHTQPSSKVCCSQGCYTVPFPKPSSLGKGTGTGKVHPGQRGHRHRR